MQKPLKALPAFLILSILLAACSAPSPQPAPATPSSIEGTRVYLPSYGGPTPVPSPGSSPTQAVELSGGTAVPAFTEAPTASLAASPTPPTATSTPIIEASPSPTTSQQVRFAVIGDFGQDGKPEEDVANLIDSWNPDLILTTGDNNYPSGSQATIDANIGKYFHQHIYPYQGSYGEGAATNRFFPTLGNHDWLAPGAQPYLRYFTLPGNERYYNFTVGPVEFFALDSDPSEPDKVGTSSIQAAWLKDGLAASQSPWRIVYFHHPPYSSGPHGSTDWMQWPFQKWGASAVLSGHDHTYERLDIGGFPYFVDGLGGGAIYQFPNPLPESQVRYDADYGAMLVDATATSITFQFINRKGVVIDTYTLKK